MLFATIATGRATAEIAFSQCFFPGLCAPCLFRELWWDRVVAWKETKVVSIRPSYCFEFSLTRFWSPYQRFGTRAHPTQWQRMISRSFRKESQQFQNILIIDSGFVSVPSANEEQPVIVHTTCHFPFHFLVWKHGAAMNPIFLASKPPGG